MAALQLQRQQQRFREDIPDEAKDQMGCSRNIYDLEVGLDGLEGFFLSHKILGILVSPHPLSLSRVVLS